MGWEGSFGPMRLRPSPRSHSSLLHSLNTYPPRPALCQAGGSGHQKWVEQNQRNLLSQPSPPPSGVGGGEAGAGQGTEDGGPGCPHSTSQVCALPSNGPSTLILLGTCGAQGQRLGRVGHKAAFSCTPPLPEVPEALDSFPNEVPGRTLPN